MNVLAHPYLPLVWEPGGLAGPAASAPLVLAATGDERLLVAAVIAQLARYGAPADLMPQISAAGNLTFGAARQGPEYAACRRRTLADCAATASSALRDWRPGTRFRVIVAADDHAREVAYEFAVGDHGQIQLAIRARNQPRGRAALDRLASHYASFLRALIRAPHQSIADVSYLTSAENAVLADLNDTQWPGAPRSCIHQLVEESVDRDPARLAAVQGASRLSYADLDQMATAQAAGLLDAGIAVGDRVGILARRSIEFIVAAFAVLKAGAAYVPLDPLLPASRLRSLYRTSAARLLLAEQDSAGTATGLTQNWLTVPPAAQMQRMPRSARPDRDITAADLAYVIFTSGSTGEAKGALLDHAGRTNMITDLNDRLGVTSRDRTLVVSSPGFDMSVYDIFGTLSAGATVVLPERGREYDVEHWARLILDERVTIWHSVPSALTLLLNVWSGCAGDEARPSLRMFLVGGDWIPVGQPARVRAAFPSSQFYSLGGATEVSVDSVIHQVEADAPATRAVPYGRPLRNQTTYVLDAFGRLAGIDQAGELALGGVGVGWGYEGQAGLTAGKFIPDPFGPRPGGRLYRTGDEARLRGDGRIELLGRLDQQVKVDGMRIELGEVQMALEADPLVHEAAVLAARDSAGRARYITAFVVPAEPDRRDPDALALALRARLEGQLPRATVPARIETLAALPLNANGKVDRRLLQARASRQDALEPQELPAAAPGDTFLAAVAGTWALVLGLDRGPPPEASFLALGGGSLAAMQIVLRLNRQFAADLTVRDVMGAETVAQLAELARARSGASTETTIPRQPR